jgi:hypothetical protein
MRFSIAAASALIFTVIFGGNVAQAHPSRIIILRHGEKKNGSDLCTVGQLRAEALSSTYLGKGAPENKTIFGNGHGPDAFFAITVHTQETVAPSAQSWGMSPIVFPIPPKDPNEDADLNMQTQAAATMLNSAQYDGKTVVVVWEHKHIAKKELNDSDDTLWSLLRLKSLPKTWEGVNYDFFWIVDYTTPEPALTAVRQEYANPAYAQIPNNGWGEPVAQAQFHQFYDDCEH